MAHGRDRIPIVQLGNCTGKPRFVYEFVLGSFEGPAASPSPPCGVAPACRLIGAVGDPRVGTLDDRSTSLVGVVAHLEQMRSEHDESSLRQDEPPCVAPPRKGTAGSQPSVTADASHAVNFMLGQPPTPLPGGRVLMPTTTGFGVVTPPATRRRSIFQIPSAAPPAARGHLARPSLTTSVDRASSATPSMWQETSGSRRAPAPPRSSRSPVARTRRCIDHG